MEKMRLLIQKMKESNKNWRLLNQGEKEEFLSANDIKLEPSTADLYYGIWEKYFDDVKEGVDTFYGNCDAKKGGFTHAALMAFRSTCAQKGLKKEEKLAFVYAVGYGLMPANASDSLSRQGKKLGNFGRVSPLVATQRLTGETPNVILANGLKVRTVLLELSTSLLKKTIS